MTAILNSQINISDTILQPEIKLMLYCSRVNIDDITAARIKDLLSRNINWHFFLGIARYHRVIPLICKSFKHINSTAVPEDILHHLTSITLNTFLKNGFMCKELLKIVELFKANNIQVLPFKGPTLAAAVYGDLTLRNYVDLDFLVHDQNFEKALNLLRSNNYKTPSQRQWIFYETKWLKPLFQFYLKITAYALPLNSRDNIFSIDLHRRLTMDFDLAFEPLWNRRESVLVLNSKTPSLPPEDLLLFLCIHASKHNWEHLSLLCDITELIRTYTSLNWSQLIQQSESLMCERMLRLGLALSNRVFEVTFPDQVHQFIQDDSMLEPLVVQACEKLLSPPKNVNNNFLNNNNIYYKSLEHPRSKILYLLRLLFVHSVFSLISILPTTADKQYLPLPNSFYFLYFIIRPIRLFHVFISEKFGRQ